MRLSSMATRGVSGASNGDAPPSAVGFEGRGSQGLFATGLDRHSEEKGRVSRPRGVVRCVNVLAC